MNGGRKAPCFGHVGLGRLAPQQVGVRSVGQTAIDGLLDAGLDVEEALARALTREEAGVARVMVRQEQVGRVGVGTRDDHRGHAEHVGCQPRRHQLVDGLAGRNQYLAAEMPAFLGGRQLIFEMNCSRAGSNQCLGQLEGVEIAAETGFRIGDDRYQPVDVGFSVHVMNLVGTQKRVVDAFDHFGHRVDRIQALVRVHLSRGVGVAGHLPA